MSQLLKRLKISYKRSRDYLHSPDPHYDAKTAWIAQHLEKASQDPERWPFFYLDEVSYSHQPSPARAYEAQGSVQPQLSQRQRFSGPGRPKRLHGPGDLSPTVQDQQPLPNRLLA